MRASRWVVQLSSLLLAALAGACATQPREKVEVSVGTQMPVSAQARDYAALYTPYSMMATAAYTGPYALNTHYCPDAARLAMAQPGESATAAPKASAERISVPTLPGSATCHSARHV